MSRPSKPLSRADEGYSVVEAAITLPVIFLLCMLGVQASLVWHARHVGQSAAREGLDAARAYQSSPDAGTRAAAAYLHDVAPHLLASPQISITRDATTVRVHIHAQVLRVVPGADFTVDATAAGPIERFVAENRGFGITGSASAARLLAGPAPVPAPFPGPGEAR